MTKNIQNNDQIDLMILFDIIWKSKFEIIFIIAGLLFSFFLYTTYYPNTKFVSTTEIRPVSPTEMNRYNPYNTHVRSLKKALNVINESQNVKNNNLNVDYFLANNDYFEISSRFLLDMFVNELQNGLTIQKGIKKFNLLKKNNFSNDQEYNDAVIKFATKIKIKPKYIGNDEVKITKNYFTIKFSYDDLKKWEKFLRFIKDEANNVVRKNIVEKFENNIRVVEQQNKFKVEDINKKIKAQILTYNNSTKIRIAFLKEQAAIARSLNIKKIPIETQLYNSETNEVYYLRGYEAIEQELYQLINRSSKEDFIPEILTLRAQAEEIKNDVVLKRVKQLFYNSPTSENNFMSVSMTLPATKLTFNNNIILYTLICFVLSSIIAIIYAIFKHTIKSRKIRIA